MSGEMAETAEPDDDQPAEPEQLDDEAVAAELEVLREENERLREEYARARQAQYRQTALTLGAVGAVAVVAGILFPTARTVLVALGGTGLFLGALTYYLTPEQFLPASVGQGIYAALARNQAALTAELGLQEEHIYVPRGNGIDDVRLFVPQHTDYELPAPDALADTFVVTGSEATRGVSFEPTGAALATAFERALTGDVGDGPAVLASQLSDALVEQFELVTSADVEADPEEGRVTVAVTDSSYGAIDRFDHPVASLCAVGIAGGLGESVTLSVESTDADDRAEYLVSCYWEQSD